MPPLRTPLAATSGNRQKGYELSPYTRGQIVDARLLGVKPANIVVGLKETLATVKYTISIDPKRKNGASQPRKPRGKSYTDTDLRHIIRFVRKNPKVTYVDIKE